MWITAYKKVEFAPFFYAHSWSDYCYWYLSQIQTEFDELEAKGDIDKWEQTLNQRSVELNEMHAKVNCDALIPNDCRRILDLLNNNTEFEKRVFVEGQKAKIQLARFGVPLSPNYNVMLDRTENEKLLIKHLAEIRDETDPESRIDAAISQLHEVLLPLTIGEKNSSKSP